MDVSLQPIAATKDLYRRLDALLGELHGREEGSSFLDATLRTLFDVFGGQLGMQCAWLIELDKPAATPVVRLGASAEDPVPTLPPDLRARRVWLGRAGRLSHAAFHVAASGRSFAFLFGFRGEWDRDAVELVLGTAGSILQVKLDEARFGAVLRQAAEIQQSLLPPSVPRFGGFELAARSVPAEEVGGDWYEFFPLEEGTLGISIGDASGHGLAAALMARDVVVGLRMGIEKELRINHVLEKLNRVLHRSALSSCFASLLLGELEENGSFFYYSAGHEAPLLVDEQGCEVLRTGGPVLGPLPEVRLRRHFAHLDHGAALVLYSDGLIERRSNSGELFGLDRLRETVFRGRSLPAESLLDSVFEAVDGFGGEAAERDDETLVVVRRQP